METDSVLVVGALGMAGADFLKCWPGAAGLDLPEIDITDPESCRRVVGELRPKVVVNCAAATGVDWCEAHRDEAMRINAEGAGNLATACAERGALIVQMSTDYVFDGASSGEYSEGDPTNPLSVYAESKLEGEKAVIAAAGAYAATAYCDEAGGFVQATQSVAIVRIGWLFGHSDKSFLRAMLRRADDAEPVRVIDDQVGCPTYSYDVAGAIERLVDAGATGTVHFTNASPCTRFEMARYIFQRAGIDPARLVAMKSSDLLWVARRPGHTVLSTAKYRKTTGAAPRHWHAAVDDALRRDGVRICGM